MARRDIQAIFNQAGVDYSRANRLFIARRDTLKQLGDPLRGSAYDSDGSRSGISDPTPAQAFALAPWHGLDQQINETVEALAGAALRLVELLNRVPSDIDTARIAETQRCTGGMGMEGHDEWGNTSCRQVYDRNYGHNAGLCASCVRSRNRWEQRAAMA